MSQKPAPDDLRKVRSQIASLGRRMAANRRKRAAIEEFLALALLDRELNASSGQPSTNIPKPQQT